MRLDSEIAQELIKTRVVAVLVVDDANQAVPLAQALAKGGVTALELTLRTPVAFEALRRIRSEVPEMKVGLGTVLTRDQVKQAKEGGAAFAVAPGLNRDIVKEAQQQGLPFSPGIMTPSDIEAALELDCQLMKFFPAEPSGGLGLLKSMAAPYLHRGVKFIPLGGLKPSNVGDYFASDLIAAVGGSWIAPRDRIQASDWETIRKNAAEAVALAANG